MYLSLPVSLNAFSGRIAKAKALLGSLLVVQPLFTVRDGEAGLRCSP